jgi:hypothetical protein
MIKLLNVVFVFSLGTVTLWLLYRSVASDKVRRSSPSKRAELFIRVLRNNTPFLNFPFNKSHYLIGRGAECDILLKGMGIPLTIGELSLRDDDCIFRNLQEHAVRINDEPIEKEVRKIVPGDEIIVYNYAIKILQENSFNESMRSDRQRLQKGKE